MASDETKSEKPKSSTEKPEEPKKTKKAQKSEKPPKAQKTQKTQSEKTTQGTQKTEQPKKEKKEPQVPYVPKEKLGIRLLYTILFIVILGLVLFIVKMSIAFQFISLLGTGDVNESVRQFSNKVSTYGYRIFRYLTFNENKRPFPFSDFSPELEPADKDVSFD